MSRNTRYSPELRERAVRMAIEKRPDYPSEWATFAAVSKLLECHRNHSGLGSVEARSTTALASVSPPTSVLA